MQHAETYCLKRILKLCAKLFRFSITIGNDNSIPMCGRGPMVVHKCTLYIQM